MKLVHMCTFCGGEHDRSNCDELNAMLEADIRAFGNSFNEPDEN